MHGIGTLLTGMKVTGREFFTKKVTEQYPDNRDTLVIRHVFVADSPCRLMRKETTSASLADYAKWHAPTIPSASPVRAY